MKSSDGALAVEVPATLTRLLRILSATRGWGYDTYDSRVGAVYLKLYRARPHSRLADLAVRALYAIEFAAPILYRRVRGIRPTWDPMGNSYRANAHVALATVGDTSAHLAAARAILDEVVTHAVGDPGRRGFALGFECITGSDQLWSTQVPVAHYTLRVARALMRYERASGDRRYRATLDECMAFFEFGLPWVERDGIRGVGYTPADPLQVINIWADVASTLASYDRLVGGERFARHVRDLTHGVLAHFRSDGTWPYFARWERSPGAPDNSHTAMVLGALADVALAQGPAVQAQIAPVLEQAVPRWVEMFFDEETGRAWNTTDAPQQAFAVTIGDTAYALLRLTRPELGLSAALVRRLESLRERNLAWGLRHLRLRNGRFCERRLGRWRFAVRSIRSFDGLIADALALHYASSRGISPAALWTI